MTDTGKTAELLNLAEEAWPEVHDRKELLLRLAEAGAGVVEQTLREQKSSQALRRAAIVRSRALLEADVLLSDQAWA